MNPLITMSLLGILLLHRISASTIVEIQGWTTSRVVRTEQRFVRFLEYVDVANLPSNVKPFLSRDKKGNQCARLSTSEENLIAVGCYHGGIGFGDDHIGMSLASTSFESNQNDMQGWRLSCIECIDSECYVMPSSQWAAHGYIFHAKPSSLIQTILFNSRVQRFLSLPQRIFHRVKP